MNCLECRDNLVAFMEGMLDGKTSLECQAHLEACAECRAEYKAFTSLKQRLTRFLNSKEATTVAAAPAKGAPPSGSTSNPIKK
jgi:predicted anti-sigma-YlaC factor YlaD